MIFNSKPTAAEPVQVIPEVSPELVALSVLQLELQPPAVGWTVYLEGLGIAVVADDIGRRAITRADAKALISEHHDNEAKKAELLAVQERRFIDQDQRFRTQLFRGAPAVEGVHAAVAMLQAAKDAHPRRRSLTEDFLDRRDEMVFHPIQDEE